MPFSSVFNLPNSLTFIRLIASPLFPFLLYYFLPINNLFTNFILAILFSLLILTDFLDGYFARKYKLETELGKAIDQIADKFLISSSLITLLAVHKIYFFWVIILIGRELFIMGLRQIALENNFSINVSYYGKLKTTMQAFMIILIILNPYYNLPVFASVFNMIELLLIISTLYLSVFSAFQYYQSFKKQIIFKD